MPEFDETIHEQNFVAPTPPNVWQRFTNWLKFLSPKKKVLFWGGVVLGVAAVAVIIYLALAATDTIFFANPEYPEVIAGQQGTFYVCIEPDDDIYYADDYDYYGVDAFTVVISYDGYEDFFQTISATAHDINGNTTDSYHWTGVHAFSFTNTFPNVDDINKNYEDYINNDSTKFDSECNMGGNKGFLVGTINFTVKNEAELNSLGLGDIIKFVFRDITPSGTSIHNNIHVTRYGAVTGLVTSYLNSSSNNTTYDLKSHLGTVEGEYLAAQIKVVPYQDRIYLDPSTDTWGLNETVQVDLMLHPFIDVNAVEANIEYDSNYLRLDSVTTAEFPVAGNEEDNPGVYKLVRGIPGDGKTFNGINGLITVVAHLNFTTVAPTSNTEVKLTNVDLRRDDGAGGIVKTFDVFGGNYEILDTPTAGLLITSGPEAIVYQDGSNWKADIIWQTNLAADGIVWYGDSATSLNRSQSQSGSDSTDHQVKLEDLTMFNEGDTVYYKVRSTRSSETVESGGKSFIIAKTTIPLQIVNLSVRPSYYSAVISWNTIGGADNGLANGRVTHCWRNGTDLGRSWGPPFYQSLTHVIQVDHLQPDTEYVCEATAQDSIGTVVTQNTQPFRTKAGQSPDANVILKVNRDRVCDKWLYCRSAVQVVNANNEKENLCFDLGVCDEQDADGNCISTGSLQDMGITAVDQIFSYPEQSNLVANFSGLAKIGLNWGNGEVVDGYYSYARMQPEGLDINIPNANFESGEVWPWEAKEGSNAEIAVIPDPAEGRNRVLKITPEIPAGSSQWMSVKTPIGIISRATDYQYAISMAIKSGGSGSAVKNVAIQLAINNAYYTIGEVPVSGYWQTIELLSNQMGSQFVTYVGAVGGNGFLNIAQNYVPVNEAEYSRIIYVDDVSMKSVLPVSSGELVARDCRMYPTGSAAACDYVGSDGKEYHGWKGFCVEEDPKYVGQMCLNWWPVDILPGESDIFGTDQQAGYSGRQPLYYCLEAAGSYPYYNHQVQGYHSADDTETDTKSVNVSNLNVYRDEIIEIRINDVMIDDDGNHWNCGLGQDYTSINPSVPADNSSEGAKGTIIFNEKNKEYWERSATSDYEECTDKARVKFNKYAYLRCAHHGADNDCNRVSGQLFFDAHDKLTKIKVYFEDGSPNLGKYAFSSITITFRGPRCDVIAQVVTPSGENAAWASRVQKGGWTQNNNLGYSYDQDFRPYGGAVVGEPISDPNAWENPLYVMPANTSYDFGSSGQVRAGSPYSIADFVEEKICTNSKKYGDPCRVESDCDVPAVPARAGICEDFEVCRISSNPTVYETEKIPCEDDSDCRDYVKDYITYSNLVVGPYNLGSCQGGFCENEHPKLCTADDDCDSDICQKFDNWKYVSNFGICDNTKDITVCTMDGSISCPETKPQPPETGKCESVVNYEIQAECVAGSADKLGKQCNDSNDCGYNSSGTGSGLCMGINLTDQAKNNITGGYPIGETNLQQLFAKSYTVWRWDWYEKDGEGRMAYVQLTEEDGVNYGWDYTEENVNEKNKPKITNVRVDGQEQNVAGTARVTITAPGMVILEFNSELDADHLPLKAYRVDWGEKDSSGNSLPITQVSNLKISDRAEYDKPHVLFHTYENPGTYRVKIQIEDNWGWCNDGNSTNKCSATWQSFGPSIDVQ